MIGYAEVGSPFPDMNLSYQDGMLVIRGSKDKLFTYLEVDVSVSDLAALLHTAMKEAK